MTLPRGADYSLTENATSPFHAEPTLLNGERGGWYGFRYSRHPRFARRTVDSATKNLDANDTVLSLTKRPPFYRGPCRL